MKKVTLILSAFALVLGLSQCKKEEKPAQSGEKQHIVLTANNGNDGSKVSGSFESAALNLTWEGTETITVSGGATGELVFKEVEGTSAIFEGDITKGEGDVVFTIGSAPEDEDFADQAGTDDGCAAWINANNHFVGTSLWQDDGNYNVTMKLQYAVLKLDVSALGTSGAMTIAVGGSTVASVTDVSLSEDGKAVFVAVPANETSTEYTITCNGKTATKTWTLKKNVFYTKAGAEGAGTGDAIVIKHEFTVGDGTTVEFAPGNLWYNTSDDKFYFEANQWDFRHYNGKTNDAAVIGGESTITPTGTVGSFFWSNTASVAYESSYSDSGASTGDVFFTNASDFQVNGETAGTWHTLSNAEWNYLLSSRTNASSLRAWVTLVVADDVNVSGLVILPDGSKAIASGVTTPSALADAGAVFLPAAGYRSDTKVSNVGWCGYYWSSTPNGSNFAYFRFFDSGSVYPDLLYRSVGYAVRLVR